MLLHLNGYVITQPSSSVYWTKLPHCGGRPWAQWIYGYSAGAIYASYGHAIRQANKIGGVVSGVSITSSPNGWIPNHEPIGYVAVRKYTCEVLKKGYSIYGLACLTRSIRSPWSQWIPRFTHECIRAKPTIIHRAETLNGVSYEESFNVPVYWNPCRIDWTYYHDEDWEIGVDVRPDGSKLYTRSGRGTWVHVDLYGKRTRIIPDHYRELGAINYRPITPRLKDEWNRVYNASLE